MADMLATVAEYNSIALLALATLANALISFLKDRFENGFASAVRSEMPRRLATEGTEADMAAAVKKTYYRWSGTKFEQQKEQP